MINPIWIVNIADIKKQRNKMKKLLIIKRLKESFTDLSEHPSPKEVFIKLRELRNSW